MKNIRKQFHFLFFVVLICSFSFAAKAENLDAQWEVFQIRFVYVGEFTQYSCDGIERKIRRLLILLGARNDARVETDCFGGDNLRRRGAQRVHRMRLAFSLPVPVDKTDFGREIFPAEWQEVSLGGGLSRKLDGGDCELVREFQRYVVPRLQVKQINSDLSCFPINRTISRLRAKMKILSPAKTKELEPEP
ncbi:MAG: hypothetical protein GKR93_14815 [Gammaproteobacteria bacterium]|nr:hypothetical protein [Gammaproteobacteria bacterium]